MSEPIAHPPACLCTRCERARRHAGLGLPCSACGGRCTVFDREVSNNIARAIASIVDGMAPLRPVPPPRRVRVYVEPRDAWMGVYIARDAVYVCPVPFLVIRIRRGAVSS